MNPSKLFKYLRIVFILFIAVLHLFSSHNSLVKQDKLNKIHDIEQSIQNEYAECIKYYEKHECLQKMGESQDIPDSHCFYSDTNYRKGDSIDKICTSQNCDNHVIKSAFEIRVPYDAISFKKKSLYTENPQNLDRNENDKNSNDFSLLNLDAYYDIYNKMFEGTACSQRNIQNIRDWSIQYPKIVNKLSFLKKQILSVTENQPYIEKFCYLICLIDNLEFFSYSEVTHDEKILNLDFKLSANLLKNQIIKFIVHNRVLLKEKSYENLNLDSELKTLTNMIYKSFESYIESVCDLISFSPKYSLKSYNEIVTLRSKANNMLLNLHIHFNERNFFKKPIKKFTFKLDLHELYLSCAILHSYKLVDSKDFNKLVSIIFRSVEHGLEDFFSKKASKPIVLKFHESEMDFKQIKKVFKDKKYEYKYMGALKSSRMASSIREVHFFIDIDYEYISAEEGHLKFTIGLGLEPLYYSNIEHLPSYKI